VQIRLRCLHCPRYLCELRTKHYFSVCPRSKIKRQSKLIYTLIILFDRNLNVYNVKTTSPLNSSRPFRSLFHLQVISQIASTQCPLPTIQLPSFMRFTPAMDPKMETRPLKFGEKTSDLLATTLDAHLVRELPKLKSKTKAIWSVELQRQMSFRSPFPSQFHSTISNTLVTRSFSGTTIGHLFSRSIQPVAQRLVALSLRSKVEISSHSVRS
jgi:hypothetical protein